MNLEEVSLELIFGAGSALVAVATGVGYFKARFDTMVTGLVNMSETIETRIDDVYKDIDKYKILEEHKIKELKNTLESAISDLTRDIETYKDKTNTRLDNIHETISDTTSKGYVQVKKDLELVTTNIHDIEKDLHFRISSIGKAQKELTIFISELKCKIIKLKTKIKFKS